MGNIPIFTVLKSMTPYDSNENYARSKNRNTYETTRTNLYQRL